MRTVFRPFWSYDLPGTEAWLADMAGKGWRLEEWSLLLRRFNFRQAEPVRLTFSAGLSFIQAFIHVSLSCRRGMEQAAARKNGACTRMIGPHHRLAPILHVRMS
ncbi:hypothetical protein ACFTAO_14845 [Paenibacillus rhizoplanae]